MENVLFKNETKIVYLPDERSKERRIAWQIIIQKWHQRF